MPGEVVAIAEAVKLLLSITDKILDRMPTYEQAKRNKYYQLKKAYLDELARAYPGRDDNLVDVYQRNLMLFLASFNTELSGAKISDVRGSGDKTP